MALRLLAAVLLAAIPSSVANAAPDLAPPFNSTWLRSYSSKVNLTVISGAGNASAAADGPVLRWTQPEHFSAIFSYLPATVSLEKKGAVANISMRWRSSGDNVCPPSCYAGNE